MTRITHNGKHLNFGGLSLITPKIPRTGLIAEWLFNENTNDTSDNNYNGVLYGSPTFTINRHGLINSALLLNGIDQYVTVSNTEIIGDLEAFSISAWIKSDIVGSKNPIYGEFGPSYTTKNYMVHNSNTFTFDQYPPSGGAFNSSTYAIQNGDWFHIVYTQNGLHQEFHINNSLSTSNDLAEVYTGRTPLVVQLGARDGYADNYFNGVLDDIRLYNRVLSGYEIGMLYKE